MVPAWYILVHTEFDCQATIMIEYVPFVPKHIGDFRVFEATRDLLTYRDFVKALKAVER